MLDGDVTHWRARNYHFGFAAVLNLSQSQEKFRRGLFYLYNQGETNHPPPLDQLD